ncbi:hypothetical protein F4779DRAFT_604733 [Xylariaceae sp. FL0662B]|nr:hypothetical protein F4779DRAFT_604733 [Xylariaceae sp. FL0662B]
MDYFKVVSSASSSTLPSEPSSDSADPTTTPPSSPPMPKSKRKTRRKLTTRVMSQETETAGNGATGQGDEEGEESATAERASTEPREQTAIPANSSQGALDRAQAKAKKRSDAGKRGRGGAAPAGPRQATVQTTLSLALNEKVFTECKECTMLYNPFHEKDVRFHARRHAAMQRARRNSDGNISC